MNEIAGVDLRRLPSAISVDQGFLGESPDRWGPCDVDHFIGDSFALYGDRKSGCKRWVS